jgi:hypothetical protein
MASQGTQFILTPLPALYGARPPEPLVPLALASLVLGSRRSETGLFEIDSGELARVRRGHETRATRLMAAPGVLFRRQVRWCPMAAVASGMELPLPR